MKEHEVSKTTGKPKPVDFIFEYRKSVSSKIAARKNILKEYHPDSLTAKIAETELKDLQEVANWLNIDKE